MFPNTFPLRVAVAIALFVAWGTGPGSHLVAGEPPAAQTPEVSFGKGIPGLPPLTDTALTTARREDTLSAGLNQERAYSFGATPSVPNA